MFAFTDDISLSPTRLAHSGLISPEAPKVIRVGESSSRFHGVSGEKTSALLHIHKGYQDSEVQSTISPIKRSRNVLLLSRELPRGGKCISGTVAAGKPQRQEEKLADESRVWRANIPDLVFLVGLLDVCCPESIHTIAGKPEGQKTLSRT